VQEPQFTSQTKQAGQLSRFLTAPSGVAFRIEQQFPKIMKKTTDPFRVTIILGDESPVAQIEQIERIIDDGGEIIASKILPAETLAMPISEEIIGALNASLLAKSATI
jgi:hypothetical protein